MACRGSGVRVPPAPPLLASVKRRWYREAPLRPEQTEGFVRLEMGATLSGVALYERCGYVRSGREDVIRCPNGEGIRVCHMVKDGEEEAP